MTARQGDGAPPGAPPASARDLAASIVRRVIRGAFLSPTLRRALDDAELGVLDRSFVTDLAYGTVRHLPRLDAALAERLRAPDRLPEHARVALRLGAYELLVRGTARHAAVHAWVEVVKRRDPRLAGLANAVLRRLQQPRAATPEARLGLQAWLLDRFEAALGPEAAARAAESMLDPGPLWLRAYADDAAEALRAEGCTVEPGPLPATLRVRSPLPLDRLAAYRDGKVQPQNPSSTLAADLLAPAPAERVLDLAAGNGIKTAQLAASGAAVTAVDVDPAKGRAMAGNLARLGLAATFLAADLTRPTDLPRSPAILLDAPCSGSGTLRAHPEIKLRLTEADVSAAAARQRAMLASAASLLERGGRLVYAVCSLTDTEGEGLIADLLAEGAGLHAVPLRPRLTVPHVAGRYGAYVLPLAGLDGFYLAELHRG